MKRFALLALLAFPAFAARTTVTGTLMQANGSFCAGTLAISNPPFTSIDGFIAGGQFTTPINNLGFFSVSLEPGPYYTVNYTVAPSGCTPTTEYWSVPISGTPVDVGTVRSVSPPPPLPNTIPLSYLTASNATAGQFAKFNGIGWVPANGTGGGATIPNTTSALKGDGAGNALAVTGSAGNCVHVDGSSAVCSTGTGTVVVVGAGNLAGTAIVTGGGSQSVQTPNSGATLDTSGNIVTPGTVTTGTGGSQPGTLFLNPTIVGSLPTCNSGATGTFAFVTDATATTFLSTVAGTGSNKVPVVCNGTNWVIG